MMGVFSRLKASDGSNQALRDKGDAARNAGAWPEAAEFYTRYLRYVPDDAGIWVQLGHARKESGDLAAAERAYLRALSIAPDAPDTHVQLGHVEKLQGRLNDAVARYRKALELDPQFRAALEELEKYDFTTARSPVTSDAHSGPSDSPSSNQLIDIERRLQLLVDQVSAVKAVAFEVQKLRRRTDDLDRHIADLGQSLTELASKSDASRSEIEQRMSFIEGQSPAVQGRFSALLELFGTIRTYRQDLERQAALIDELMRRTHPTQTST